MNNKALIWAYYMMLSEHFAEDADGRPIGMYVPPQYTEENQTDLKVWDDTIRFVAEHKYNTVVIDVGDQVLYESHPEISAPNAFTKEFVKQKLDEIRALGMTPIPKLNFSACHHVWLKEYTRMVSTPVYYKVCSDLIAEVCELFDHPKLFDLDMDEENYDCQNHSVEKILIRGERLWWHDLYFLFDEVEKNGARPWVSVDYFWHHPKIFLEKMPKSVLQSNWYYKNFRDLPPVPEGYELPDSGFFARRDLMDAISQDAYQRLADAGYDQLPICSAYVSRRNQFQTLCHCKQTIPEDHLVGYMTASWFQTRDIFKYALLNDAFRFYEARREVYPESL